MKGFCLEKNFSTFEYIIDKKRALRGRDGKLKPDEPIVYGYDASSVADLTNTMVDDVKVIIAEYANPKTSRFKYRISF